MSVTEMNQKTTDLLRERFKDAILTVNEYRGELTIVVQKKQIVKIAEFLRDDETLKFDSIRDICGVDYYRPDDRYEVVYNLYSLTNNFRLRLKVRVAEEDPHVPTVTPVWEAANWPERETFDMYGLIFD